MLLHEKYTDKNTQLFSVNDMYPEFWTHIYELG